MKKEQLHFDMDMADIFAHLFTEETTKISVENCSFLTASNEIRDKFCKCFICHDMH